MIRQSLTLPLKLNVAPGYFRKYTYTAISLRIVAELLEEADQEEARKPGCVRYLLMIRQSIILPGHLVEIRKDL